MADDTPRPPLHTRIREAGGLYAWLNTQLIRLAGPASVGPYEPTLPPSAEERAERAKMEGALLVARTVAHEINNALAPITGYAELLAMSPTVAADERMVAFARRILWASTDVAAKVKQLQQIIRLEEVESPLGPDLPLLDLERSTGASSSATPAGAAAS